MGKCAPLKNAYMWAVKHPRLASSELAYFCWPVQRCELLMSLPLSAQGMSRRTLEKGAAPCQLLPTRKQSRQKGDYLPSAGHLQDARGGLRYTLVVV